MRIFLSIFVWMIPGADSDEGWVVKASLGSAAVQVRSVHQAAVDQPFAVRVVVTAPPGVEVDEPTFMGEIEGGKRTDISSSGPDPTGEFLTRGWQFQITPTQTGEMKLPPIQVVVHVDKEPLKGELKLPAIAIATVPVAASGAVELPPVKVGNQSAEKTTVAHILLWVGFGLLMTTVIVGFAVLLSSRPTPRS